MDETPIKAGRTGNGKMKQAYFWPVYGDRDEICFAYYRSRAGVHVRTALAPAGYEFPQRLGHCSRLGTFAAELVDSERLKPWARSDAHGNARRSQTCVAVIGNNGECPHLRPSGFDPSNISGHSPRIGSTQDMGAAGFSGPLIKQQGRWKSERMVARYLEHLHADRGAMPPLLELRRAKAAPE